MDKFPHHLDALGILNDGKLDAGPAEPFLCSKERLVLTDHDARNLVKKRGATAHRTGGKRGVENTFPVNRGGAASGILKGAHLPVKKRIALLHAHIVSPADDLAPVDNHRSDGDAPFLKTFPCLVDSRLEKWIAHASG